jgi:hypothetical protein
MGKSHTRLRLELVPQDRNTEAKAKFSLQAFNVDVTVHKCLEVTDCMNLLSQQSGPGFALRNSKRLQLQCLLGAHPEWGADLKKVCEDWIACLPSGKQEILKGLLRAMVAGAIGLLDMSAALLAASGTVSQTLNKRHEEEECVDPGGDDPEAWDCECHEKMMEACGHVGEKCFLSQMCKHPDVCNHWKESAGCPPLASTLVQRSVSVGGLIRVESNFSQKQSSGDRLEESLQGKCNV